MGIIIPGGWHLFVNFLFYFARIAKDLRAWSGAISCFSGRAKVCRIYTVASSKDPQWRLLPSNLSVLKALLIHPWPLIFLYLWLLQAASCPPLQNLPCLCLPSDGGLIPTAEVESPAVHSEHVHFPAPLHLSPCMGTVGSLCWEQPEHGRGSCNSTSHHFHLHLIEVS